MKYEDIPDSLFQTVEGHAGTARHRDTERHCRLCDARTFFHFYEGYDMKQVTFPVRVMKEIGIETCIVTNTGGKYFIPSRRSHADYRSRHINMMGTNPLIGPNDSQGVRFPDMSAPYDKDLLALAEETAQRLGISVQQGVYAGMTGPSYETPAEVRFLRTLGADAVGMSTVPEVIVASQQESARYFMHF
ncbi:purine-nucleoside phosphorylase [Bacillus sp. SL00103]